MKKDENPCLAFPSPHPYTPIHQEVSEPRISFVFVDGIENENRNDNKVSIVLWMRAHLDKKLRICIPWMEALIRWREVWKKETESDIYQRNK